MYQVYLLHAEYIVSMMYGMYDLITIGSISVDMYYKGESLTKKDERFSFAIGGKYFVDYFYEGLGGGAANVAIGAKKLGLSTAIVGKIGENQFKHLIQSHLKDNGVSSALCHMEKDYIKISTILLSPQGERTIIHYETPHEHILSDVSELSKLENSRAVYMSNLGKVALEERKRILSHLYQRKVITAINLGITDCRRSNEQIEDLLHHVNILILNTHEFAEMAKKPIETINFKKDVTQMIPILKTKIVAITDGKNGSYVYFDGGVLHEAAHIVSKVVDTTGAGDAFSAGFLSGYLMRGNIEYALHLGNKLGAQIVQKIGAN